MMNGMVKRMKKILTNKKVRYALLFIGLCVLCYCFPFTHDDWAWGSDMGLERLHNHFDNYNGRWAGNLVVIALTRSNLLKTIAMALTLTLIVFFIEKLVAKKNNMIFYLGIFLLSAIPYLILRQAVVWTSGFANYVVATLFMLWYFYLNRNIVEEEYQDAWWKMVLCFALGFIGTLFVEHVTVYLVVLALFMLVYHAIKYKKVKLSHVFFLIGTISGTILMFSNSVYGNISSGEDGYRSFAFATFITSSLDSYQMTIYKELVFNNYVLNVLLSGCIIAYLTKIYKTQEQKTIISILIAILVFFPLYSLIIRFQSISIFLKYTDTIHGSLVIIYILAIFISALFVKEQARRNKIIFALGSIAMLTAPLFVVTPIGSRCFFPMYILWIWIVLEYAALIIPKKEFPVVNWSILCATLTFFIYLFCVYGYICLTNTRRIEYIEKHQNDTQLTLPKLPYKKYVWYGEPSGDEFMERFKAYYGIKEETEIEFVSLGKWKKVK